MHPSPDLYDAVARGEVPREFLEEIEREHLAAHCRLCTATIADHRARQARPGAPSWEPPRDRLDPLRDRLGLDDDKLRVQERKARGWVRRLVKIPAGERREKVNNGKVRYKGKLFCLLLLEEARRHIPGDPAEAESLADAALAANRKTAVYQADPEVQAAALAVRGNARRALGNLLAGAPDLAKAKKLLDSPLVTDVETPPEVYSYLGSLCKDQGHFEKAAGHLHRAAVLYRVLRKREKAARILLNLGTLHYRLHEPAAAVVADQQALRLLDSLNSSAEDWLHGYAHYNLAFHLHAAGETERAEAELAAHEELIEGASDQLANLLVWLRARIAWSRQELGTAQRLYTEARQRALDRGIAWDAGLVGLELALVRLVRGHTDQGAQARPRGARDLRRPGGGARGPGRSRPAGCRRPPRRHHPQAAGAGDRRARDGRPPPARRPLAARESGRRSRAAAQAPGRSRLATVAPVGTTVRSGGAGASSRSVRPPGRDTLPIPRFEPDAWLRRFSGPFPPHRPLNSGGHFGVWRAPNSWFSARWGREWTAPACRRWLGAAPGRRLHAHLETAEGRRPPGRPGPAPGRRPGGGGAPDERPARGERAAAWSRRWSIA